MNETSRTIEAAKTANGGWTKATLAEWGVTWPPNNGWRKDLIKRNALKEKSEAAE